METYQHHRSLYWVISNILILLCCAPSNAWCQKSRLPKTSNRAFLGIGTELTGPFRGSYELNQQLALYPIHAIEFKLTNAFHAANFQYHSNHHIKGNGYAFSAALGGCFLLRSQTGNRRNRLRFGLEYSIGQVNQISTYTIPGRYFESALYSRRYSSMFETVGLYSAFMWMDKTERWYIDVQFNLRSSDMRYAEYRHVRYVPGNGIPSKSTQEWYQKLGISIGRALPFRSK